MNKKENLLECSLTYGDASSIPLFFIKDKKPLSFNYDCTLIMTPKTGSVIKMIWRGKHFLFIRLNLYILQEEINFLIII